MTYVDPYVIPFDNPMKNWKQNPVNDDSLKNSFKPKKAGKNGTHLVFVLDYSSSMMDSRDATISAFNEYIESQKNSLEEGENVNLSLYKFDGNNVDIVFWKKDIRKVEPLDKHSYDPAGTTNLNDAIGGVIMSINKDFQEKRKKDRSSVILTVLTDGMENTSKTFGKGDIMTMVKKAQQKNWGFVFLGADINAFDVGMGYGFSPKTTLKFSKNKMCETLSVVSEAATTMRHAYNKGLTTSAVYDASEFTSEQRSKADE